MRERESGILGALSAIFLSLLPCQLFPSLHSTNTGLERTNNRVSGGGYQLNVESCTYFLYCCWTPIGLFLEPLGDVRLYIAFCYHHVASAAALQSNGSSLVTPLSLSLEPNSSIFCASGLPIGPRPLCSWQESL